MLTAALRQVFALAEAYPQLRAVESFNQLQATLNQLEDTHSERAPLLQRGRPRSEHENPGIPFEHHRRHVQFQAARILRDLRSRRTRNSQGKFRRAAPRSNRIFGPSADDQSARAASSPLLLAALAFALPASAREMRIQHFESLVTVNPDGTIDVSETIDRQFHRRMARHLSHHSDRILHRRRA